MNIIDVYFVYRWKDMEKLAVSINNVIYPLTHRLQILQHNLHVQFQC